MRKALSVGLASFDSPGIRPLPRAATDAESFHRLATDPHCGECADFGLVLSPPKADLEARLNRFFRALEPGDEFVLYIAGHASHLRSGLLTFDCRDTEPTLRSLTGYCERDLRALLLHQTGVRGILILDTCYAESFRDLRKDLEARGPKGFEVPELPELDPAHLSLVYLFACGSRDQTFEDSRSGMFTGLLLEAMRDGAGTPPASSHVSPAAAINWVRERLRDAGLERAAWPSLRALGRTDDIFLCRNPTFDVGVAGDKESNRLQLQLDLTTALANMIGRLASPPQQVESLQDLRDLAQQVAEGKAPHASCTVIRPSWLSILGRWMGLGVLFPVFAWWVFSTDDGCLRVLMIALGPVVGLVGWIDPFRTWRRYRKLYVLLTPEGLYKSPEGLAKSWGDLRRVERRGRYENGWRREDALQLSFNGEALALRIDADEFYNLDALQQAVEGLSSQWYAILPSVPEVDPSLAPASRTNPDSGTVVEICAFAAGWEYDNLPGLSSPAADLGLVSSLFERLTATRAASGANMSRDDFLAWLGGVFRGAAGANLLLYFSGHGLLAGEELVLALKDTEPERPLQTGFPVSTLFDLAGEARTRHVALVLDCCFAGAGGQSLGFSPHFKNGLEHLFATDRSGFTIVAAAADNQPAFAPVGHPSLFTGFWTAEAHRLLDVGEPCYIAAVSRAAGQALEATGIPQVPWSFLSESGSEVRLRGQDLPNAREVLRAVVDERAAAQTMAIRMQLQSLAKSSPPTPRDEPGTDIFLGEDTPSTTPAERGGCGGCLGILGVIYLLGSGFWEAVPVWVGLCIYGVVALNAAAARKPRAQAVLTTSGNGIALNDQVFPAAHVASVHIEEHRENNNGSVSRHRFLVLVTSAGTKVVLASSLQQWSHDLEFMAEKARENLARSRTSDVVGVVERLGGALDIGMPPETASHTTAVGKGEHQSKPSPRGKPS